MTAHLKPSTLEPVVDTAIASPPGLTMRGLLHAREVLLWLGGGDRRALDCGGAAVPALAALGSVNLCVSIGGGLLIAVCSISLFEPGATWRMAAWFAAAGFGLMIALINVALMHGLFESYGMKQLSTLRARRAVPKLPTSQSGLLAVRILISISVAAFLMVPVKLSLTKTDQRVEIANEQNRRDLPYARAASDRTNRTMDDLSKRIDAARLPISALIFEKAMIETAELAGDVPSVPAELAPHVRPEIFALAKKVETLNREEQKLKTDRDEELKLVRRLEQNIIAFTRQGRRQAAAAAVRQRNAAQQRADAFSRQIATAANDIADGRARLKVYGTEVALRLGRLQQESNENQAHLDSIEKVHDQLISERVRSSPGYQRVSSGFIGSIESLGRLWKSSATARAAMIGIVLLIAVLDLMPLLMKAATKLPAYALRIATDSQRAFAHEAAATLSSDIQFMRLMNQIETELDDIRKVEHDRSSDWYRNYPPMIWVRLTAALSLFRKRKASSNAKPVSGNVTGQAA